MPKFDIWYCPSLPLDAINASTSVRKEGMEEWRPALAENIRQRGLVNPLIVLNHRDPRRYKLMWLKTGNNRLWALKHLGWATAPCIVTGTCDHLPKTRVTFDEAKTYFKDGELEIAHELHGTVLQLKDVCRPENYEYPNEAKSTVQD